MKTGLADAALDEAELTARARALASRVHSGGAIHLTGDLGVGKTTFARALLGALGVGERIKSPTYSLIESYRVGALDVHHLDLYRLADASELEWLGLADLSDETALFLIEWPERGVGRLPPADLIVRLAHNGERRDLHAVTMSKRGDEWLAAWPTANRP